jgi:A/G-specific adenine glycosylase
VAPSISEKLLGWYQAHARSLPWRLPPGAARPDDPDFAYRVWLSEIMLQQTTVEAVQGHFARFTSRWPTVQALAAADDAEVMAAWAGLGYYARARNLLACARAVVADHGGRFPATEAALRALPGIGDYSAAAIAAIAFGQDAVVVDGNIERVTTRLFAIATPLPRARTEIRAALAPIVPNAAAGDFAQAMMDLARRICTPRAPRCLACPISADCAAQRAGNADAYPVKLPKRARPLRHGHIWWIEAGGAVLTVIRPAKGLLGGMRALPGSDWLDAPPQFAPPLAGDWQACGSIGHGFTHFELQLAVHAVRLPVRPGLEGEWVAREKLLDSGLPTVFRKAALQVLGVSG